MPENVAKVNSYEIVRRVRCEMRDSIRAFVIKKVSEVDPQLAAKLRDDAFYRGYDQRLFDPETRAGLETYKSTVIGYSFTFNITESNKTGATADFADGFGSGFFKLGMGAGTERKRNNTQTFRVVDTFDKLTRTIDNRYCKEGPLKPNFAYPITGHLNLVRLVKTYLDLNQSANLGDLDPASSVPTLTETMEFTTEVHANLNPKVEADPTDSFDLVAAGVTADASREDIHKVTIVLTLPPDVVGGQSIAERRIDQEIRDAEDRDETRNLTNRLDKALK